MKNEMTFPELRERAIALRREGKSLREIKQLLGVGSNRKLAEAVRGERPPVWTRRPRAKDHLHARARQLRADGRTYAEIASELGVSKSSVSLWVRDMPRPAGSSCGPTPSSRSESLKAYWAKVRSARKVRKHVACGRAAAEIGTLSERDVLISGAIAYWCEGAKSKPHRPDDRVSFINSDPGLIRFFLRFLSVAGVTSDRLICRVYIHESADVPAADRFWQDVTGLGADQFRTPVLKRHNPKTVRKNVGANYHGGLKIDVRQSADLYWQIEGWVAAALTRPELVRGDV
jgi:hypothetical protein